MPPPRPGPRGAFRFSIKDMVGASSREVGCRGLDTRAGGAAGAGALGDPGALDTAALLATVVPV